MSKNISKNAKQLYREVRKIINAERYSDIWCRELIRDIIVEKKLANIK